MSCPISRLCWANRKLYWWSFARRGWPASSLLPLHWEISFFFLLGWNGKHFWPELWAIRKKIANNYKWRGGLFIEQRKYDWGVSPRRIIPPFVSARTSQFVQLTVFCIMYIFSIMLLSYIFVLYLPLSHFVLLGLSTGPLFDQKAARAATINKASAQSQGEFHLGKYWIKK